MVTIKEIHRLMKCNIRHEVMCSIIFIDDDLMELWWDDYCHMVVPVEVDLKGLKIQRALHAAQLIVQIHKALPILKSSIKSNGVTHV